jgi:uncharacterized membrane protein YeaQ/YmgE (transglycosylase-associated protein family)
MDHAGQGWRRFLHDGDPGGGRCHGGGYVSTLLGMGTVTGFNLPSIIIATVGALIVLFVYNKLRS